MLARDYVIRACQLKGLDLIKPTKGSPEIIVMDYRTGFGRIVVDAQTWAEARTQLNAAYREP